MALIITPVGMKRRRRIRERMDETESPLESSSLHFILSLIGQSRRESVRNGENQAAVIAIAVQITNARDCLRHFFARWRFGKENVTMNGDLRISNSWYGWLSSPNCEKTVQLPSPWK